MRVRTAMALGARCHTFPSLFLRGSLFRVLRGDLELESAPTGVNSGTAGGNAAGESKVEPTTAGRQAEPPALAAAASVVLLRCLCPALVFSLYLFSSLDGN
jgi:hypothetical protein